MKSQLPITSVRVGTACSVAEREPSMNVVLTEPARWLSGLCRLTVYGD